MVQPNMFPQHRSSPTGLGILEGPCGVVCPCASYDQPKDRLPLTTDLLAFWLTICYLKVSIDFWNHQSPGCSQQQVSRVLVKCTGERKEEQD